MLELQNGYIVCFNFVLALFVIFGVIDYCTFKVSVFVFMESLILGLLDCSGVSVIIVLFFYISIEMFQGMRVRLVSRGCFFIFKFRRYFGSGRFWYVLRVLKFGNNSVVFWLWFCGFIFVFAFVGQRDVVGVGVFFCGQGVLIEYSCYTRAVEFLFLIYFRRAEC